MNGRKENKGNIKKQMTMEMDLFFRRFQ